MENKDFYQFMQHRVKTAESIGSNCAGTASYLVGEIDSDRMISREDAKKINFNLSTKFKPEKGYLVVWGTDGNPIHEGVIFQENPYKVLHRNGSLQNGGGRLTLTDLSEMSKEFNSAGISTRYKVPSKLELIE
ncbi:MAG: hypothetical protein PF542_06900 [Nanoarchaeota archaeon]|jgi:hypothetical protein|nr:hypothetical protein [Nanoarchaeota archaeon]